MKNLAPLMMIMISIFIIISCQKDFQEKEIPGTDKEDKLLEDIQFSSNFNWETSRNVFLTLTSSETKDFYIRSADGNTRYFHARHPGQDKEMQVTLNLPASMDKIRIGKQEVAITSATIKFSLND
ncbi:MAG: hypothetical protein K9G58_15040 [Bacteroidales bacterium]|nr:hypothetical protein [Bacteroidales bacterium]MCF8399487.1 hypothetical protein [Bacteroidales bacterium]